MASRNRHCRSLGTIAETTNPGQNASPPTTLFTSSPSHKLCRHCLAPAGGGGVDQSVVHLSLCILSALQSTEYVARSARQHTPPQPAAAY